MSSVMLLQNEKLVVDEFLEKVAAASRKVCLPPKIAFFMPSCCPLHSAFECCLLLSLKLGDHLPSEDSG